MTPKSKYERLHFLAASLAKLLEKTPPTYYDETPLATWVETVDRVSGELSKELGGNKSLAVALDSMAALQTRADEAQDFVQKYGLVGAEFTWFSVLDYAQKAAIRQRETEAAVIKALEAVADARTETMNAREENSILEAEVSRLKDELARAPRRFKTV